jgi:hypothetical protein
VIFTQPYSRIETVTQSWQQGHREHLKEPAKACCRKGRKGGEYYINVPLDLSPPTATTSRDSFEAGARHVG